MASLKALVCQLIQWSVGAVGLFDLEHRLDSSRSSKRLRTQYLYTGLLQKGQSALEQGDVLVHFGVSVRRPSSVTENMLAEFVDMIRNFPIV